MTVQTPEDVLEDIGIKPAKEYKLTYDSTSETLEPIYFWILDFMSPMFGGDVKKLVDNFTSSPGSGHFSELMGKATRMQEEAMKIYGMVNTVLKSILNIIYDLKEFQIRLKNYDDSHNKDETTKNAGILSLKQIWMDKVDIKRGRGSINMLAQDLNFVTLRDAFMAINSPKAADKLDLNDRVRRILKARIQEFNEWKKRSESELRKRYEIERTYLKTQVATVKMYSRWVKPYLKAAEELAQGQSTSAGLVKSFNSISLQLTLFAKSPIKVVDEAQNFNLPADFVKIKARPVYKCVLIDFNFRGIPQKAGQHYVFGGKADVKFSAYALNEDEVTLFEKKLDESDLNESLKLIEGMTEESLGQLQDDIDEFLEEETDKEKREYEDKKSRDVNPFAALLGLGTKKPAVPAKDKKDKGKKEKKIGSKKDIKSDNYAEATIRAFAAKEASGNCYAIYDIYKKGHGMASTPDKV
jgi:hypothetical protein